MLSYMKCSKKGDREGDTEIECVVYEEGVQSASLKALKRVLGVSVGKLFPDSSAGVKVQLL